MLLRLAVRLAARLFVRGSKLADAMAAGARLAARGRATTLGYFNADGDAPRAVADACLAALDAIAGVGAATRDVGVATSGAGAAAGAAPPYLSIKVPALGFDDALVGEIVDRATPGGVGIHFDSHGAAEADQTFAAIEAAARRLPREVSAHGAWRLGCTLPGRWPRSLDDAARVAELGLRVRVVKGQWADPAAPAVDLRQGFLAVIDRLAGTRIMGIFPNLVVIDLVMGVLIRKIDPVTPDYMEVTAWELAPPEEGPELRRQRLDNFLTFWGPGGLGSPDDVEALETCQRSFAASREMGWSDISRGMNKAAPTGADELQMRTWWRRWNELIAGEVLPPEPHDELDAFHLARRRDDHTEATA